MKRWVSHEPLAPPDYRHGPGFRHLPLVQPLPPELSAIAAISLGRDAQNLSILIECVVARLAASGHRWDVGDGQGSVDDLAEGCVRGECVADSEWPGIADAVLADKGPVGI